jgi:hypothetical protein
MNLANKVTSTKTIIRRGKNIEQESQRPDESYRHDQRSEEGSGPVVTHTDTADLPAFVRRGQRDV